MQEKFNWNNQQQWQKWHCHFLKICKMTLYGKSTILSHIYSTHVKLQVFWGFSEAEKDVWYYSTPGKLNHLMQLLDPVRWETRLVRSLTDVHDEVQRQMKVTENLTQDVCGNRKTSLEIEVGMSPLLGINGKLYLDSPGKDFFLGTYSLCVHDIYLLFLL